MARVFPWQEVIVPHANQKVKDGVFSDAVTEAFIGQAIAAFVDSIGAGR